MEATGGTWVVDSPLTIVYQEEDLRRTAEIFAADIEKILGYKPALQRTAPATNRTITLSTGDTRDGFTNDEEYILTVAPNGVTLKGATSAGVWFGLQTLRQLLAGNAQWTTRNGVVMATFAVPTMTVHDKPSFGWRGAMLDVARHFADKEDVKRFLDMMAMHKLNTFHWHLVEDQGWRIEIKSRPELMAKASVRTGTLIGHGGRPPFVYDDIPYAGGYTQDDIREVVAYAAERHITIIPEIEMPGHVKAVLYAYPELGCTGGPYEVWRRWGVTPEVFCAGNDEVFALLEDVLTEVLELFPSKIIHIGGDECPKDRWKECEKCQARIKAEGLANEYELQSYFIRRMEKWLNERGRIIIGWDEILEGGLAPNAMVMSWRGHAGGVAAASKGHYVVMAPNTHVYLDYYQSRPVENEPPGIGGFLPLEKVYQLDPYNELTPEQQKYVVGVQGNLWREYMKTMCHTYYMALPRLAAIAEVGWSHHHHAKDFEDFVDRLSIMRLMYEIYGFNYARHIWEGGGRLPRE